MKKKITQLSKGIMDSRNPLLAVQTPPIDETVICGQCCHGQIELASSNGIPFRGLIYADDDRIEIPESAYGGLNATVEYILHAEDLRDNTEISGSFALVTNAGDFSLDYRFRICQPILLENEIPGTARQLGEMAAEKPDVTRKLFESESFLQLPLFRDASLRALYLSLRKSPDQQLAMEEFLVAVGAKEPVTISVNEAPRTFLFQDGIGGELVLTRAGEGYTCFTISTTADFIRLPGERFTGLDFVGNTCRINLTFVKTALHRGKNIGKIYISTGKGTAVIPVTVLVEEESTPEARRTKQYRRSMLQLYRTLLKMYGRPEEKRSLENQAVKYMDACDLFKRPEPRERLLRAEVYRELGRRDEEKQILDEIRADIQRAKAEDTSAYLWFLYLEEEMERGNRLSDGFLRLLYRMKESNVNDAEVFPLQLRADSEWAEQPERSLGRMREFFEKGSLTLLLKTEACHIYNDHPEFLERLEPFERHILAFGARNHFWNEAMAKHAAELLARQKQYDPAFVRILSDLYGNFPDPGILYALLSVLIRSGSPDARYHEWYVKGISEDVRLTELYEYYLSTLPEDFRDEIPQMVLLYYTYNSPQLLRARLNLYHYILRHYEPDSHLYRLYEKQMQNFALEQLLKRTMDDSVTEFYEAMFIPEVLDVRTAVILSEFLYTEQLYFSNRSIREVILVYGELKEEFRYPVENGTAYVPVYTRNARALYADENGNRYCRTSLKRRRFLSGTPELLEACRRLAPDALPFRLEACRKAFSDSEENRAGREEIEACLGWDELSDGFREQMIQSLIRRASLETVDSLPVLHSIKDSPFLDETAGRLLTESFIRKEDDEAAIELLHRYGYRGYSAELLLTLLKRQIRKNNYAFEQSLYRVSLSLYRGGDYNPTTLSYLCLFFNGSTADMKTLLELTEQQQARCHDLPERLLAQMLFTGELEGMDRVAELYLRETDIPDRTLMHAYEAVQSERYFREGAAVPDSVFDYMRSWIDREKKVEYLPTVCQIAMTKYFSEKQELNDEEKELAGKLLASLYNQGLLFSYEQKLGRFIPLPAELADKTLIEYRGSSEVSTEIGFRILPKEKDLPFAFSEMPHIYRGIYVKPVLLFADESLEYEIRTVSGGTTVTVDKGTVSLAAGRETGENRFAHINRILAEAGDGSDPAWREKLLEFGKEDVLLKDYFNVI